MIQVVLVDDEPAVRRGLRMRLKLVPDIQVVGEAGDGEEALRLAQELKPDVIVMDLTMPRLDGIQATQALRKIAPNTAVVMLTLHSDETTRALAEAAGAAAFVAKGDSQKELIAAIRQTASRARSARSSAEMGSTTIRVPFPEADGDTRAECLYLRISVGVCRLTVKPTAGDNWVEGTYADPSGMLPLRVVQDGAMTRLTQEHNSAAGFGPFTAPPAPRNPTGLGWGANIAQLELELGKGKPYELTIESGASECDLDLGGLPLNRLAIRQGAGKYCIDFTEPNPEVMNLLSVGAGACSLEMHHLANANMTEMSVQGGAAAYKFDLSGVLRRDTRVRVATGFSSVEFIIPLSTAAQVTAETVMGTVDVGEGFAKRGGTFYTGAALDGKRPMLTIQANNALGVLRLRTG
jgi:CheY-like chemotaxis protein